VKKVLAGNSENEDAKQMLSALTAGKADERGKLSEKMGSEETVKQNDTGKVAARKSASIGTQSAAPSVSGADR